MSMKKIVFFTVLVAVVFAPVFAQEKSFASNAVTIDVGPTLAGFATSSAISQLASGGSAKGTGFGIGAQYERVLFTNFSVAGRFAFLSLGVKDGSDEIKLNSFSVEAHARWYPTGKTFFLDGMAGIGTIGLDGKFQDDSFSSETFVFFKPGAKLGWKVDFGNPGGFVFESALGWAWAIGDDLGPDANLFKSYIFVGGPKISFNLGWAF
jgi:hypothetical protein